MPVIANVKELNRIDNLLLDSEDDGPCEMLERVVNAEFIITDSFHVMIYAILCKKPFVAYSRIGSGIRLRNMLEDLDLSSKFLLYEEDGFEEILKPIDYEHVFEIIDEWRASTMKFLNDALND